MTNLTTGHFRMTTYKCPLHVQGNLVPTHVSEKVPLAVVVLVKSYIFFSFCDEVKHSNFLGNNKRG